MLNHRLLANIQGVAQLSASVSTSHIAFEAFHPRVRQLVLLIDAQSSYCKAFLEANYIDICILRSFVWGILMNSMTR